MYEKLYSYNEFNNTKSSVIDRKPIKKLTAS